LIILADVSFGSAGRIWMRVKLGFRGINSSLFPPGLFNVLNLREIAISSTGIKTLPKIGPFSIVE
jgi:hypothetical protein